MLKPLRQYLAWFLLLTLLPVAAPRAWMHHCHEMDSEFAAPEQGDQTHTDCDLCKAIAPDFLEAETAIAISSQVKAAVFTTALPASADVHVPRLVSPRAPPLS